MFHNYLGCCKCRMCNKRWKSDVDEAPERSWGVCDYCPFTLCADCMGRKGCALRFDDGHERICSQNPCKSGCVVSGMHRQRVCILVAIEAQQAELHRVKQGVPNRVPY